VQTRNKFNSGEWVEVRSKEEILSTLDKNGELDGLPFMPEMFPFCGKRFRVDKRAHKTCDTITGKYEGRKMESAVHIEGLRCDGQAHGGCEAGCSFFWKEAWLKRASLGSDALSPLPGISHPRPGGGCSEADVIAATRVSKTETEVPIYSCQATRLLSATTPLSPWDPRQYVEDLTSGNIGLRKMINGFIYMGYQKLINLGIGLGAPLRWLYDAFQRVIGGIPYPRRQGKIPNGAATPAVNLGLQPGELVRVKSYKEILSTCATSLANRGMYFDAEMVPYCGKNYRVLRRVSRIINEKDGKMREMKTPCIILESVVCQSRYSECRLFCPRSIFPYWREIWLERVTENNGS